MLEILFVYFIKVYSFINLKLQEEIMLQLQIKLYLAHEMFIGPHGVKYALFNINFCHKRLDIKTKL